MLNSQHFPVVAMEFQEKTHELFSVR